MLKVGYYQFRPVFGQVDKNVKKVVKALSATTADLVVLPELAFTGYYFRNREEAISLAEDPDRSETVASLVSLCKEKDFYLVAGFAERKKDRVFNSALLLGPEGLIHTYRKLHLFFEEKKCFDPGDTPLTLRTIRGAKLGMMICFDWIFPEVTRSLAVQGADIICHPANLVLNYCQQTMLARCLENSVFAITANRFGADRRPHGELKFTGRSQIVAPRGQLLHRAPSQRNELFVAAVDLALARDKNITSLNDMMRDRRPEFYSALS